MNIEQTKSLTAGKISTKSSQGTSAANTDIKFADELKKADKSNTTPAKEDSVKKTEDKNPETKKQETLNAEQETEVDNAIDGLQDVFDELNKVNQKDDMEENLVKSFGKSVDKKDKIEDFGLIDNNMNIQEPKDKINLEMGANMNFNSNGEPFAEFVNPEKTKNNLKTTAKDVAEEKAIMSTMEENIAIANKNMAIAKTKTVENEQGIHKVDKKTNLVVDTIVSYEKVIMDKADVEFFTNLVENGVVDMTEVKGAEKSSQVSKTLADLLAKAMNDNKPVRIDFDNNISVIIKIDRAGKISADFLPSSQVAEAYLKENLPLLRQKFEDNNLEYNELNQRQRKQENQDNRKKGRKDE